MSQSCLFPQFSCFSNYNSNTMPRQLPAFKRIAVGSHPRVAEAMEMGKEIAEFLRDNGVYAETNLLYDEALQQKVRDHEFDLFIALGGDGTMLRAGHLCAPFGVPILGVNLGRFGFLMEILQDQWRETLPRILAGEYWLERRMMLFAEQWRGDHFLGSWEVVNEVAVSRGSLVRPIHLTTHVDGRLLTTYVADALLAATPTGSTAYALAAGGPILPPELRNILLVAVAPHLSLDRAVVLSEGASVTISVRTDHQASLSIDGQPPIEMKDGDRVYARASEHSVIFVRHQDPAYFYRNLTSYMNQNPSIRLIR